MKPYVTMAGSVAALACPQAHAAETLQLPMTVPAGASTCLPNAHATVIDHSFGDFENLAVAVSGLPAHTGFDFFIIQVPNTPFGAAW